MAGRGRALRMVWMGLLVVGALYGGALALMYVFQGKLLYHGSEASAPPESVGLDGVSEVRIESHDGLSLRAWWREPAPGHPVVLYFHGNAGTLADRAIKFARFGEAGYGLLMPAYRGYSGNAGEPRQSHLIEDAVAAAEWLARRTPDAPVVYFGESLGGSVALHLAMRMRPRAIVLEGAFDSAANLAQARYPIFPAAHLIKDPWDSLAIAPAIASPVLMLHGSRDGVVPISHARRLFQELPEPKQFVRQEGAGHVDLFEHGAAPQVLEWLAAQGL